MALLYLRDKLLAICAVLPVVCCVQSSIAPAHFYPFGTTIGDAKLPKEVDGGSFSVPLTTQFTLYGTCMNTIWVTTNGLISFDGLNLDSKPRNFRNQRYYYPVVASYWSNNNITREIGQAYYRTTTDTEILQRATTDVSNGTAFEATMAVVATWHNVTFSSRNDYDEYFPRNTFQTVLVTNGSTSFVIFNYGNIDWTLSDNSGATYAVAGVNALDRTNNLVVPDSGTSAIDHVSNSTNCGTPGRRIYRVDGETVPTCQDTFGQPLAAPTHFYPYGTGVGDTTIAKGDTKFSNQIPLRTPFVLYGSNYSDIWITTDGYISFDNDYDYDIERFDVDTITTISVTAFVADIDTEENDAHIYFRESTDIETLERASTDVADGSGFSATWVFIATWHQVTYYSGNSTSPTNTFQVILVSNGSRSYAIFNYGDMTWGKSPNSDHYALAGANAGDGVNYVLVPASDTPEIVDIETTTNDGTTGRWHFRIDTRDKCMSNPCLNGGTCSDGYRQYLCSCAAGFKGVHCETNTFDCNEHSPCTASNRALNKYFFEHSDATKYVRCSAYGRCWVRPCPPGTVFEKVTSMCTFPRG